MFLLIKNKSCMLCFLIIPGVMPVKSPEFGTGRKFPGLCFMIGGTGLSHVEKQMFVCANISLLKQHRVFQSTLANLISRTVPAWSANILQDISRQSPHVSVPGTLTLASNLRAAPWGEGDACSALSFRSQKLRCVIPCAFSLTGSCIPAGS